MAPSARRLGRRGLQSEVLLALCLVMATATVVLAGVGLRIHDAELARLRSLAVRGLVEESRGPFAAAPRPIGSQWWLVLPDGSVVTRAGDRPIDAEAQELAVAVRERGEALVQRGAPWEPMWFATSDEDGNVSVARIPPVASAALVGGLVLGAIAVFTAFGATLLRGRLVTPLERLAAGVRAFQEGSLDARVAEEGSRETAEVARAFNEMAEALAGRTRALEKAVTDLRESNRSLRAARESLDRAERLAAVGRLAAGIAHEVGNPMGAILALLDLVGRDAGLSEPGREIARRAAREGERVRVILRALLDFSRPARGEPGVVDVVALVGETVGLVQAQRRYAEVDFRVEGEPGSPPAFADRAALSQVLLNLLLNAADAVLEKGGGRVAVRVRGVSLRLREGESAGEATARRRLDAVEARVEDDGPGIAPEDRERIFDPFFTTKAPGEGTGLGLSNALRITEQMGGRLDLDVDWSDGAAFVLRLPLADADPSPAAAVRDGAV